MPAYDSFELTSGPTQEDILSPSAATWALPHSGCAAIDMIMRGLALASSVRLITGRDARFVLLTVSTVFVAAGLAWPQAADGLLRLLVITLAVLFAAGRVYSAVELAESTEDHYSPFHRTQIDRSPPAVPRRVRDLATQLRAADDPVGAGGTAIPIQALLIIREESDRRLADHRGLRLREASDHPRIRQLVTYPTWSIIRPPERGIRSVTPTPSQPAGARLSQLGIILDDLEGL